MIEMCSDCRGVKQMYWVTLRRSTIPAGAVRIMGVLCYECYSNNPEDDHWTLEQALKVADKLFDAANREQDIWTVLDQWLDPTVWCQMPITEWVKLMADRAMAGKASPSEWYLM